MCRLFGFSSAPHRTRATFWLLDAPDSLSRQSHRAPDGTGLGHFTAEGTPHIDKAPIAAYRDRAFAHEARQEDSATFIAHVRFATTGNLDIRNTHPFEQDGRLFAHNGMIQGLAELDDHLGEDRSLVQGDTDSERFFALITRETRRHNGDVSAGIRQAARWIATNLPIHAINLILITPEELWALRYPDTHGLYVLERPAGGLHGNRHLDHSGSHGHMRIQSGDLTDHPAVIVASERMDDNPHWQQLQPGELLHVGPDLRRTTRIILPDPPAHRLTPDDLPPDAATSQKPA